MPKITLLKDVNKLTNNYNTVRFILAKYKYDGKSSDFLLKRRLIPGSEKVVTAYLGGNYKETITSTWSSVFSSSNKTLDSVNKVLSFTGFGSLKNKYSYLQVWEDTQPIVINLNLNFIAYKDPLLEVEEPIRQLQGMISPQERTNDGQSVISNIWEKIKQGASSLGPNVLGSQAFQSANEIAKDLDVLMKTFLVPPSGASISLSQFLATPYDAIGEIQIGNFIKLKDIIIEDIDFEPNISDCDIFGTPTSATVSLKIKSRTVWTDVTILNLLKYRTDCDQEPQSYNFGKLGEDCVNFVAKLLGFENFDLVK
jgi:hypothetical protein